MAKGLRKDIKQSTHTLADKKLGRVFVDLSGPKVFESLRGFSRYTWAYFLRHRSDAAKMFEKFLTDTRADGVQGAHRPLRWGW